jgi:cell division ATPase FtsA
MSTLDTATRILALDIGTRNIVGLLLEKTAQSYRIRAAEIYEHQDRVMFDGQVHDVAKVAAGVRKVKQALERRTKSTLTHAAVAAAGRALVTTQGEARREQSAAQEITPADVRVLELEAVRAAQDSLRLEHGNASATDYLCVGYSASEYILEGAPIANLEGQFGREIGIKVVATFLPRVVVDSLFAVLRRADLAPVSLTMEPIAALEVSIPAGMRQLNLALVDIGAGTSDIALVRRGSIFAYAMVPVAGDEITDALCEHYLLDFAAGEAVKRQLSTEDKVSFVDILGQEHELEKETILKALAPSIERLASQVAAEILKLNGRPPDAVLLVGGGSLTPTLPQALAGALELPENRVGLRSRESITNVTGQTRKISGPQAVTPIGIGVTAFSERPFQFLEVTVNNERVFLWQLSGQTVAAALLAAGTPWKRLFGRPGLGLTVEVNGKTRLIPGEPGRGATIMVNGKKADLDTPLTAGAVVDFAPGKNGRDASITVAELIENRRTYILNGTETLFPPAITINGNPATLTDSVPDRARVEILWERSVREVLLSAGLLPHQLQEEDIPYYLGGRQYVLHFAPLTITLNARAAQLDSMVRPGDRVQFELQTTGPTVGTALKDHVTLTPPLTVTVNGQALTLPGSGATVLVNGRPAKLDDPIPRGAEIALLPGRSTAILSDLFTVVDMRKEARPGATFRIIVNGEPGDFTTPLHQGDEVTLTWG